MAPEVAFKKEYSKSVDIWSTGVIMYMLMTEGNHPLYLPSDDAVTYREKL
jgi:serine/threonine protein kinase